MKVEINLENSIHIKTQSLLTFKFNYKNDS